jgi:hypothetical protein
MYVLVDEQADIISRGDSRRNNRQRTSKITTKRELPYQLTTLDGTLLFRNKITLSIVFHS